MLKNYLDKKISITRQKYLGTYKDTKKTNKVNAGGNFLCISKQNLK